MKISKNTKKYKLSKVVRIIYIIYIIYIIMIYKIAGSLAEIVFFSAPIRFVELSTQGTYWVGKRVYRHYYPEINECDLLKKELYKLKFELDQLKNNKWVLI